jgi:hypothetical protein
MPAERLLDASTDNDILYQYSIRYVISFLVGTITTLVLVPLRSAPADGSPLPPQSVPAWPGPGVAISGGLTADRLFRGRGPPRA